MFNKGMYIVQGCIYWKYPPPPKGGILADFFGWKIWKGGRGHGETFERREHWRWKGKVHAKGAKKSAWGVNTDWCIAGKGGGNIISDGQRYAVGSIYRPLDR